MGKPFKFQKSLKSILKLVFVMVLGLSLILGNGSDAWAARSGGRMGGGSFRAPSRSYSAPSRTYSAPSSGYSRGGYGGGMGFNPFFFLPFPLFGFGGGGGLLGLLVMVAVASFLVRTVRQVMSDGGIGGSSTSLGSTNPKVTVAKVQLGLSAQARSLQTDLGRMALSADTSNTTGLIKLLQESTLTLLRHPEFWVYGSVSHKQTRLTEAETEFNRLVLEERSKFVGESLSNVQGEVQEKTTIATAATSPDGDPGEYIIVTLVVGTQGKVDLPTVHDTEDLQKALGQIGAISSDQLLALEILWTPQVPGEVLSAQEVMAQYPNLTLV